MSYRKRIYQRGKGNLPNRVICQLDPLRCQFEPEHPNYLVRWYPCSDDSPKAGEEFNYYQCIATGDSKEPYVCNRVTLSPGQVEQFYCRRSDPALVNPGGYTCYFNSILRCLFLVDPLINHLIRNYKNYLFVLENMVDYSNFVKVKIITDHPNWVKKILNPDQVILRERQGEKIQSDMLSPIDVNDLREDANLTFFFFKLLEGFLEAKNSDVSKVYELYVPKICRIIYSDEETRQQDSGEFISELITGISKILELNFSDQIINDTFGMLRLNQEQLNLVGIVNNNAFPPVEPILELDARTPESSNNLLGLIDQFLQSTPRRNIVRIPDDSSPRATALPPYLIIRFHRISKSKRTDGKPDDEILNSRPIQYPLQFIFPNEYLFGPSKNTNQYELISVSVHHGKDHRFGHYTAYAKIKQKWYEYDDSNPAKLINSDKIKDTPTSRANILIYRLII